MKRYTVGILAIVAVVVLSTIPTLSHAAAVLAIDIMGIGAPGSYEAIIVDNGAGDGSALPGVISFSYSAGGPGTAFVDVTTGLTKPVLGSSVAPHMDLNSVILTEGIGAVRTVFADAGFDYSDILVADIGGTLNGGTLSAAIQTGASLFSLADLFTLGTFNTSPFATTASGSATLTPSDILALTTVVSPGGNGPVLSSYDIELQPVPEPGTMMLLGSGLVGLAGWGRKKFRK